MVRCREIRAVDLESVTDLLTHGFNRTIDYWTRALNRLTAHDTPPGFPKYGFLLESDGRVVGVVLLISAAVGPAHERQVRCNVSSWYVEPAYRSYGAMLASRAIIQKDATFFNVSPAAHTWTILELQGFQRFAAGRIMSAPILNRAAPDVRVLAVTPGIRSGPDLNDEDVNLLLHHRSYGCLSLVCESNGGRHPFVFGLDLRYGFLPVAHLVYCRDIDKFVEFAGAIGGFLIRRGYAFVILDANGPMRGIVGKYFGNRPRYCKGAQKMRLGDVAYSEQLMFGY